MTETEARQQKILVALFLLLGRAYDALPAKKRENLTVLESEIAKAWAEKKSPIRVLSRKKEVFYSEITELEEWGGKKTKISVSVDKTNWQTALSRWQDKKSQLVDRLLWRYVTTGGSILIPEPT